MPKSLSGVHAFRRAEGCGSEGGEDEWHRWKGWDGYMGMAMAIGGGGRREAARETFANLA